MIWALDTTDIEYYPTLNRKTNRKSPNSYLVSKIEDYKQAFEGFFLIRKETFLYK